MKKRNAFTLVELLAIIAILGVIAILVLPNLNSNLKKEKEYDKIVTIIKSAAKLYHINNKNATKVYISTLISDEYLSSGIINPITDDVITGCVVISKNANDIKEYEYINNISDCDVIALQYTLTVVINEGSLSQTFEDGYASGAEIILQNPTKTGSVFTGWTVSGAGSNLSGTTLTIGTEDTTITANWLSYMEMFTYTVNNAPGVANTDYELIDDGNGNWRIKFKTNGTFTPLLNMTIDVFLVGGGGGGATGLKGGSSNGIGGGGGGGYTSTTPLDVSKNNLYSVVIGVGGGPGSPGAAGGSSSFGTTSVLGGSGGCRKSADCGGNGGSGGSTYYGVGGSNGGNGENYNTNRGVGQGTTTCEFGQGTIENGCDTGITLYAGGGTAGTWNPSRLTGGVGGGGFGGASDGDATAGTNYLGGGGGGGGGGDTRKTGGGAGGSGIVIIRNHRVSVN